MLILDASTNSKRLATPGFGGFCAEVVAAKMWTYARHCLKRWRAVGEGLMHRRVKGREKCPGTYWYCQ